MRKTTGAKERGVGAKEMGVREMGGVRRKDDGSAS